MNKGYIIIFNVLILATISALLIIGVTNPILSNYSSAKSSLESKKTFLLANSAADEALYRLKKNKIIGNTSSITLSSSTATININDTVTGKDIIVSTPSNTYQRNIKISLALGTGVSFHYGIQSGNGGFELGNSSSVTGNIFSSGAINGDGNNIYGDVISSGPSGLINRIHITGNAFAHTISDSIIDKNAYYTNISGTTVNGISYPGSPDQATVDLPISDDQITEWENDALAGGIATCSNGNYTISSTVNLGPKKIPCDLIIKGNGTVVTLSGPIWVAGNISTQTGPEIRIDPILGNKNIPIIAHNPLATSTSGKIDIGQSTTFQGSGSEGSYVFLISQNNSAQLGGSEKAITIGQSSDAVVVYASHGLISVEQTADLKEATGYKIKLNQSANVTYDTGLANSLFSSGPGGGYNLLEWKEI